MPKRKWPPAGYRMISTRSIGSLGRRLSKLHLAGDPVPVDGKTRWGWGGGGQKRDPRCSKKRKREKEKKKQQKNNTHRQRPIRDGPSCCTIRRSAVSRSCRQRALQRQRKEHSISAINHECKQLKIELEVVVCVCGGGGGLEAAKVRLESGRTAKDRLF